MTFVDDGGDARMLDLDDIDQLDPDLSCTVQELISFTGSEHLLRAVRMRTLLEGCGKIFSKSGGTAATYELSQPVSRIGYFVSHNWAIPRVIKFVALAFKFNMTSAFAASIGTFGLCSVLGALGVLPTLEMHDTDQRSSIVCRCISIPVTLGVLLFGSRLRRWFSGKEPTAFLDKACIHQVDSELQQQGIRKLGAFLRSSDRMLVLYSPLYLRKLWTIYEVASFMALRDVEDLEVVPVALPCAMLLLFIGGILFQWSHILYHYLGLPGWLLPGVNWVGSMVYFITARMWHTSKAEIQATLKQFDVANANCAQESDRSLVQQNIVALMKASKIVQRSATDKEALEAFNQRVRVELSSEFDKIFGRCAYSYMEYLVLGLNVFAPYHADCWSAIGEGVPWRKVIGQRSMDLFWDMFGVHAWHISLEALSVCFIHLSLWQNVVYLLVMNTVVTGCGSVLVILSDYLTKRAETENWVLLGLGILQVFTTFIDAYFVPRIASLHRNRGRKPGTAPSARNSTRSTSSTSSCEEVPSPGLPCETTKRGRRSSRRSEAAVYESENMDWGDDQVVAPSASTTRVFV